VPETHCELGQIEELNRVMAAKRSQFGVQFICAGAAPDPLLLKEIRREAAHFSAAIVATARVPMPPKTTELRIVDREGRERFARQKADRRSE
jgi:hypothetical protein